MQRLLSFFLPDSILTSLLKLNSNNFFKCLYNGKIMISNYKIRKYKAGDESGLIKLYPHFLPDKNNVNLGYWNWKFNKPNFNGMIFVAENDKGEIVGQFCFRKLRGFCRGKEYLFFDCIDSFIFEDYRGAEFVKNILSNFFKSNSNKRINYVLYGFPNTNSVVAHKDNSIIIDYFKARILSKKTYSYNFLGKDKLPLRLSDNIISRNIDFIWNNKKNEIESSLVRDWKYIKWRLIDGPTKNNLFILSLNGTPVGYFSVFIKDKICYISDIFILNKYLYLNAIKKIEDICKRYFLFNEIKILISDKNLYNLFLSSGFRPVDEFTLSISSNFEEGKQSDFYFTLSDTDFF